MEGELGTNAHDGRGRANRAGRQALRIRIKADRKGGGVAQDKGVERGAGKEVGIEGGVPKVPHGGDAHFLGNPCDIRSAEGRCAVVADDRRHSRQLGNDLRVARRRHHVAQPGGKKQRRSPAPCSERQPGIRMPELYPTRPLFFADDEWIRCEKENVEIVPQRLHDAVMYALALPSKRGGFDPFQPGEGLVVCAWMTAWTFDLILSRYMLRHYDEPLTSQHVMFPNNTPGAVWTIGQVFFFSVPIPSPLFEYWELRLALFASCIARWSRLHGRRHCFAAPRLKSLQPVQ